MQDASSKQQKYKPNHQQTGLPPHSALPIRGKTNKQTNKQRLSIIKPPLTHYAGSLIQTTNKTKIQTQSSTDRITTSLSLAHQRKNNNNKNSAQISPYMKLIQTTGQTLGGQKPKGGKNSIFFKERIQLSLKPEKWTPQTQ